MIARVLIAAFAPVLIAGTPVSLVQLAQQHCPQFGVSAELALRFMRVESGCKPYALGVQSGGGHHGFYPSDKVVARIMLSNALNRTSNVGIGALQINWRWWGKALGIPPESLLEPSTNILVGCGLLGRHLEGKGPLIHRVGRYHSKTQALAVPYRRRVLAAQPCSD